MDVSNEVRVRAEQLARRIDQQLDQLWDDAVFELQAEYGYRYGLTDDQARELIEEFV